VRISTTKLIWRAGGRDIMAGIEFSTGSGDTVGLIGPNGSGKSTLRASPDCGGRTVRYDDEDVTGWDTRRISRLLAFVEQTSGTPSDLRVGEVIALAREPFRARLRGLNSADHDVIDAAIRYQGLAGIAAPLLEHALG
jgi:iron complex transport system ATP-binding protein